MQYHSSAGFAQCLRDFQTDPLRTSSHESMMIFEYRHVQSMKMR